VNVVSPPSLRVRARRDLRVSRADATLSPKPQARSTFVTSSKKISCAIPNGGRCGEAGYFRYTNEDDTGAISYANLQWQSAIATSQPALVRRQRQPAGRGLLADQSQGLGAPNIWA